MFLRRLAIENARSIRNLEMEFAKGSEPGWHVVLGPNGSGKSSLIRSFALVCMGEKESYAARQDYAKWIRWSKDESTIQASFSMDKSVDTLAGGGNPPSKLIYASVALRKGTDGQPAQATFSGERVNRTVWGNSQGWLAASFGPYRRFTGGDRIYDRLFVSNRRLAPHLTALGEDVALTEALGWLTSLHVQALQDEKNGLSSLAREILNLVRNFVNDSQFLPYGAIITDVTNDSVIITDGNGSSVPLDQLSDGYRSALSLTLELIRQMFELYGPAIMRRAMSDSPGAVTVPGVVAIDEVDAHLHPTWQRDIGRWLTSHFPNVQFIVTTHSPIVCRAIVDGAGTVKGSVWKLPAPGSDECFQRVEGTDLDQLLYGDVLDALQTGLFGDDVSRSKEGTKRIRKLAQLNRKSLHESLTKEEAEERRQLRIIFPNFVGFTSEDAAL